MGKYSLKKKEYALSEEVAHDQMMLLIEYYDIDIDSIGDEKTEKTVEQMFNKLVEYVRLGKISIEMVKDDLKIIQNLSNGTTIEYKEVGSGAQIAMDKYKSHQTYHRIYALMGNLSGIGEAAIKKLKKIDSAVVQVLGTALSNA